MLPEAGTRAVAAPPGRASSLALGVLFLLFYLLALACFPHLPGEFSYFPVLEPLPFAAMRGFTFEQLALHVVRLALLGPALAFLSLGLAGRVPALAFDARRARRLVLLGGGVSLLLSTVVLTQVLRGRAIVDDELTYRDQAMLLADGKLAEPADPPLGREPFTIESRLGRTGKYLFGEPLVQIPGALVGLPGVVHLLLAGLALAAWWRVTRATAGDEVGLWSTLGLALSPMFVLTNGTGLAHTTSLAAVVLAGLGLVWCDEGRGLRGSLLAGGALGFLLTVRPQVALPVGGTLAVVLLARLVRARRPAAIAAFVAAGAPWAAAVALYDRALTGSPWRLPWDLYPLTEKLGFVGRHTPWRAVENLVVSLVRWNGWWLGLPFGLGVLLVWQALGRPARGLAPWWQCGLALVAFNALYYSSGVSDTGPVYYFELLLPASLVFGHVVAGARERWPRLAAAALLVHLALGTGSFLVEQTRRLARLHQAIHGAVDTALAGLETPALLFHESRFDERGVAGWVLSFPVRWRSPRDPIVTYPRRDPEEVQRVAARWPDRRCYYFHLEPRSGRPEVLPCAAAAEAMRRPADPEREGRGRMAVPTALRFLGESP